MILFVYSVYKRILNYIICYLLYWGTHLKYSVIDFIYIYRQEHVILFILVNLLINWKFKHWLGKLKKINIFYHPNDKILINNTCFKIGKIQIKIWIWSIVKLYIIYKVENLKAPLLTWSNTWGNWQSLVWKRMREKRIINL